MKRSEMIKIMVNAYSDRIKDQMIYFDKEDANRLLTAMEAAGMKPPVYSVMRTTTFINIEGEEIEVPFEQSQNMWEAE